MRILYLVNDISSGPGVLIEEADRLGASAELILAPQRRCLTTGAPRDVPATAEGFDALMVLGGVMGVYEEAEHPFIEKTRALIRLTHDAGKPIMGVCLGAQLVASTFGGRVYKMTHPPEGEWGFLPQTWLPAAATDPILGHAPQGLRIMQWHGDTFELPAGAVRLATRATCANQAFRIADKTYGFQFHLEVTRETVDIWTQIRAETYGRPLEEVEAEMAPQVEEAFEPQAEFARRAMAAWMGLGR